MDLRIQPSGHDACGVGFIAHLRGRARGDIVARVAKAGAGANAEPVAQAV